MAASDFAKQVIFFHAKAFTEKLLGVECECEECVVARAYLRLREAALQDHGPSIRHPECPLCAALEENNDD